MCNCTSEVSSFGPSRNDEAWVAKLALILAFPFRVMRNWNSRRSSSFSTRSTSCHVISAVTARLMLDLCVRVQCQKHAAPTGVDAETPKAFR